LNIPAIGKWIAALWRARITIAEDLSHIRTTAAPPGQPPDKGKLIVVNLRSYAVFFG
jgi:hypothetical protein